MAHSAVLAVALSLAHAAHAGSLEQAKRIHDRLAGTPPSEQVLLQMKAEIDAGDMRAAADIAMENDGFYNATLKNWAAPWTNRDFDVFTPLNDYIATVIGIVRDERDFRELLYGNHLYISNASGLSAYNNANNNHYAELEAAGHSLKDTLVYREQHSVTGLPADATAGVITTRAAAKAFFIAGTNRSQFRYTLVNHLCMDLEQVHDVERVPDRIRQDVSRSPGGDSRVFLNTCMGCHAGMDPLTQSMAYYDFNYDADGDPTGEQGQIEYNVDVDEETGSRVQPKYFNNDATFPYGFRTPDDSWSNYWRVGQNAVLGWDEALPGEGQGLRSLMQELAHTDAFASCAVRKVFKHVCLRDAHSQADLDQLAALQTSFAGAAYNIKNVFAESAMYCAGN
ncbi:hypothetical protein [Agaribacterium haliotis]|uniref:hypothetical protein n=1 Tax=Agaribacterium haliotis TaxID=2013869 RepID=UPI000BB54650